MIRGYARVSRKDQDLSRQLTALEGYGIAPDMIYQDKKSGVKVRPDLERLMREVEAGDTVVVQKLDRFGRSILDLLTRIDSLKERGIGFVSLNDNIDTSTSGGRLTLHILSAIAEYERELIRERIADGLQNARANGVQLGRRKKNHADQAVELAAIEAAGGDAREEMKLSDYKYYKIRRSAYPDGD